MAADFFSPSCLLNKNEEREKKLCCFANTQIFRNENEKNEKFFVYVSLAERKIHYSISTDYTSEE